MRRETRYVRPEGIDLEALVDEVVSDIVRNELVGIGGPGLPGHHFKLACRIVKAFYPQPKLEQYALKLRGLMGSEGSTYDHLIALMRGMVGRLRVVFPGYGEPDTIYTERPYFL